MERELGLKDSYTLSLSFCLLFMHICNSDHIVLALLGTCPADASYGNETYTVYMCVCCSVSLSMRM